MIENTTYYRPIQYLGLKTRAMSTIVSECQRLYNPEGFIVDLFSGSSVVSQALYQNGMRVISNDVLAFCSDIASCMLNQHRQEDSLRYVSEFATYIDSTNLLPSQMLGFESYIEAETQLLNTKNLLGLKDFYKKLPQVGKINKINSHIEYINKHIGRSAFQRSPLIANYYAGTYFGIKQSLHIDALRTSIEQEWLLKKDVWEYSLLLTALYNTCSVIVHSAGKHFAQPIVITDTNKDKITNHRLFENRGYEVKVVFKECIANILYALRTYNHPSECIALNMDICDPAFDKILLEKNVSILYADPPYTAQQYSRFYHIPEVLHTYAYPQFFYNIYTIEGNHSYFHSMRGTDGRRRFFTPENGQRLDLIMNKIREWYYHRQLNDILYSLLISIVCESVEKISNTQGTYHDFQREEYDTRALNPLTLRLPPFDSVISTNNAHIIGRCQDSLQFINEVPEHSLIYIDPPYNFRQYTSYYFMLNLISSYCELDNLDEYFANVQFVRGQNMNDDFNSTFCKSRLFIPSLTELIQNARARYVILSYYDGRNHKNKGEQCKDSGIAQIEELFRSDIFVPDTFELKAFERTNYQSFQGHTASKCNEFLFIAEKR